MTVESLNILGVEAPAPAPVTGAVSGTYTQNTEHAAEAIYHLIEFFRHGPRNQAVLTAAMDEVQALESVFWYLKTCFDLTAATGPAGEQLDYLGAAVGEGRNDRSDADYLLAIRVRILVNSSTGTPEEILAMLELMYPAMALRQYADGPGAGLYFEMPSMGSYTLPQVTNAISPGVGAGIRLSVAFSTVWTIGSSAGGTAGGIISSSIAVDAGDFIIGSGT